MLTNKLKKNFLTIFTEIRYVLLILLRSTFLSSNEILQRFCMLLFLNHIDCKLSATKDFILNSSEKYSVFVTFVHHLMLATSNLTYMLDCLYTMSVLPEYYQ